MVINYLLGHIDKCYEALKIHICISITTILINILIAIPLGVRYAKFTRIAQPIMNLFNFIGIIPSLATPPILINTCLGVKNIDIFILESAEGMGMDNKKVLFKIEVPKKLIGFAM